VGATRKKKKWWILKSANYYNESIRENSWKDIGDEIKFGSSGFKKDDNFIGFIQKRKIPDKEVSYIYLYITYLLSC
jgi:hypothetical protein